MQPKQIAIIEKGVVVPAAGNRDEPTTSYGKPISILSTIRAMKKGDSFKIDQVRWRRRVTALSSHAKIKVTTRALEDGKLLITRK